MPRKRRPNLLFILADQLRYDAVVSRPSWLKTPNLDQLASEGVSFDRAFCSASPCVPSRACLLTSRYAELHRTWHNTDLLPPPERTWTGALDEAGWQCVAVGRTHHIDRGFETVRVPYGKSYPMIDYTNVHEIPWGENGVIETSPAGLEEFYETRVAETTCRLMEDLKRSGPFALYTGFILPHPPFVLPEPYASLYDPAEIPWKAGEPEPELRDLHEQFCPPQFGEARQRKAVAAYYGMVSLLDECVGRILRKLDALDLRENTLIVFTSDHGEQLGHRGLWNKGFGYDPSIRVPLLLRWPERLKAGARFSAFTGNVDLGPTILEALGVEPMPHRSGRSLWEIATGGEQADRNWLYSSFDGGRGVVYRDGNWKCIDWIRSEEPGANRRSRVVELYDLERDPLEETNLAREPAYRETVADIREKIWTFQRTELNEPAAVLYPENRQEPTFNAQFRK